MPTLLIEEDHFLKIVPVILDPDIPDAHRRVVADFFAHDVPDFFGWCGALRARMPGLYPTKVVWAADRPTSWLSCPRSTPLSWKASSSTAPRSRRRRGSG